MKSLRKLIREMALKDVQWSQDFSDDSEKSERVRKYTSSNLFLKKASRLYSEKMGFPDSNVWIRNASVRESSRLNRIDPDAAVLEPKTRAKFYEPTDKLLIALNINPEEFDKSKDVAILSVSETLSPGFLPTPHMIIHAIVHGDYYWDFMTEEETVLKKCASFSRMISDMSVDTGTGEIPDDAFNTQTKSLRSIPYSDKVPELLTAYFLNYKAASINIPGKPDLSRILDQKAKECVAELRGVIRGKIVVVYTVLEIET